VKCFFIIYLYLPIMNLIAILFQLYLYHYSLNYYKFNSYDAYLFDKYFLIYKNLSHCCLYFHFNFDWDWYLCHYYQSFHLHLQITHYHLKVGLLIVKSIIIFTADEWYSYHTYLKYRFLQSSNFINFDF
jgi:hypothetical protein